MHFKSPQLDLMCILYTGKGNITFINNQNLAKHFNDEHNVEFDKDFVVNAKTKDSADLDYNIEVENVEDKMLCIICSSKGKATFANKEDTHHLNNQHQCVADDKDFLIEVHNKKSDVNAENMFIAEEASNLDEDTTMEVEDNHPVEDIEVTYKTDEDSIQDALKELFIQEENLRKLTEEVKKSIDIKDSNAKNDTASVVETKIASEIKVEKTNVKLDPSKKNDKSDVIEIKVPERDTLQSSKPSKTAKQKFTCEICNQEFAYKGNLKKHMIKIHGEPNVKTLEILKNLPRGIQKHLAHGLNMFLSPSHCSTLTWRPTTSPRKDLQLSRTG